MDNHFYAVIMAGGGGTRLWPLSRTTTPKQMLHLFGDRTLFQIAVDRLAGVFDFGHIYVVTVASQAAELEAEVPQIPAENFLIEPMPRGTASVVAMAAATLQKKDPEAVMAILTADHFIENIELFERLLLSANEAAVAGSLVTLGITPTFPSTGYGYLEHGKSAGSFKGLQAFEVKAFREKPDEKTAAEFLARGGFTWNSGMFVWKTDVILGEFARYMPELFQRIQSLLPMLGVNHSTEVFVDSWKAIKPETIDYGIMEKSTKTVVLPAAGLGWSDVGSWDSIFDVLPCDENGNIILKANSISLDSSGLLVASDGTSRLVVALGLKDLIIVDTNDAVLVCPRHESQRVKELVTYLKEHHFTAYL
ncbi:MAG: sugar phosphate nucleotidyltransferase [Anaerolineaceae bacterium]